MNYEMQCYVFVYYAEKSRGKDKESDSLKQTKDRPKRFGDKSDVDQQKQKNVDGRYICSNVSWIFRQQ